MGVAVYIAAGARKTCTGCMYANNSVLDGIKHQQEVELLWETIISLFIHSNLSRPKRL